MNLQDYDYYIVAFSGGKDSLACLLELLEQGAPKEKIELWHHCIDGREGSTLMDWPVTTDYCRAVGRAFEIPVYYSWKEGGFEREMTRKDQLTAPVHFEYPENGKTITTSSGGITGKKNTRLKFPQVSADLRVRWCSAYLKIDVCDKGLRHQARFTNKRVLVLTGERAQESIARAKYQTFEPHRADLRDSKTRKRHIDHWRPVHTWDEKRVWDLIEKYQVEPHPAYILGWGRLSCMTCIFGSADQWASVWAVAQAKIKTIANYEKDFGLTIHRTRSVMEQVNKGKPYESITKEVVDLALSKKYTGIIINPNWTIPAGAYGESTGPT